MIADIAEAAHPIRSISSHFIATIQTASMGTTVISKLAMIATVSRFGC